MTINFEKRRIGHRSAIYKLLHDKENQRVISAGGDGWIASWEKYGDNTDGLLIADAGEQLFTMSLCEKSGLLAAGAMSGSFYWMDTREKKVIKNIRLHKKSIFACLAVHDQIISLSGDGSMIIWDTDSLEAIHVQLISSQGLRCMAISPSGKLLAIGSSDHSIYLLETENYRLVHRFVSAHSNSVFTLKFTDDTLLLSGGRDAMLRLWDLNTLQEVKSINAHWYTINDIEYIADINLVITASRDKTIRLWNASDLTPVTTIDFQKNGHVNSVNTILWDSDTNSLYSAGDDREIKSFKITI